MSQNVMGRLYPLQKVNSEIVEKSLKSHNIKREISLDFKPSDICILPNSLVAAASFQSGDITIYTMDFYPLRMIYTMGEKPIKPYGITTDNIEHVYFTDVKNNSVFKTDLNLNKIVSFGKKPRGEIEINDPRGICYHNDKVFVCDERTRRVLLLSPNLVFIAQYKFDTLDYFPFDVQVIDNTMAVRIYTLDKQQFTIFLKILHLETNNKINIKFEEKLKYTRYFGKISLTEDGFCEIDHEWASIGLSNPILYIYDKEGNISKQIELEAELKPYFSSRFDGFIVSIHREVYILAKNQSKILYFINPRIPVFEHVASSDTVQ